MCLWMHSCFLADSTASLMPLSISYMQMYSMHWCKHSDVAYSPRTYPLVAFPRGPSSSRAKRSSKRPTFCLLPTIMALCGSDIWRTRVWADGLTLADAVANRLRIWDLFWLTVGIYTYPDGGITVYNITAISVCTLYPHNYLHPFIWSELGRIPTTS